MIRQGGRNFPPAPTPAMRPDESLILPLGSTNDATSRMYAILRFDTDGRPWLRLDLGSMPDHLADWFSPAAFAAWVFGLAPLAGDQYGHRCRLVTYADVRGMVFDAVAEAQSHEARS